MYLDGEAGEVKQCDRCGRIDRYEDDPDSYNKCFDYWNFWELDIFKGRPKERLGEFCLPCTKKITPLVFELRDVDELRFFVNKLWRAINERKKNIRDKNNR